MTADSTNQILHHKRFTSLGSKCWLFSWLSILPFSFPWLQHITDSSFHSGPQLVSAALVMWEALNVGSTTWRVRLTYHRVLKLGMVTATFLHLSSKATTVYVEFGHRTFCKLIPARWGWRITKHFDSHAGCRGWEWCGQLPGSLSYCLTDITSSALLVTAEGSTHEIPKFNPRFCSPRI